MNDGRAETKIGNGTAAGACAAQRARAAQDRGGLMGYDALGRVGGLMLRLDTLMSALRGTQYPRGAHGSVEARSASIGSPLARWRRVFARRIVAGDKEINLGEGGAQFEGVDIANVGRRRAFMFAGTNAVAPFVWPYADADAAMVWLVSGQGDRRVRGNDGGNGGATTLTIADPDGMTRMRTSGEGPGGGQHRAAVAETEGARKAFFITPSRQGIAERSLYNFNSENSYDVGFARVVIYLIRGLSVRPELRLTIGRGARTNDRTSGHGGAFIVPLFGDVR